MRVEEDQFGAAESRMNQGGRSAVQESQQSVIPNRLEEVAGWQFLNQCYWGSGGVYGADQQGCRLHDRPRGQGLGVNQQRFCWGEVSQMLFRKEPREQAKTPQHTECRYNELDPPPLAPPSLSYCPEHLIQ